MSGRAKSYLLVTIQFACLLAIALTGPLLARNPLLLLLEGAGIALGLWAVVVQRIGNFNITPEIRAAGTMVKSGPYALDSPPHVRGVDRRLCGTGGRQLFVAPPGATAPARRRPGRQVTVRGTTVGRPLPELHALPERHLASHSLRLLTRPTKTRPFIVGRCIPARPARLLDRFVMTDHVGPETRPTTRDLSIHRRSVHPCPTGLAFLERS